MKIVTRLRLWAQRRSGDAADIAASSAPTVHPFDRSCGRWSRSRVTATTPRSENERTGDVLDCVGSLISRVYHDQNKSKRTRRGMSICRGDAYRQPGRYFAARFARFERIGRDRLRRHAADAEAALAFRHTETAGELPRAQ